MINKYIPKKGDFFTCLSESFEDAKIYIASVNEKENNRVYASYSIPASNGKEPGFVKISLDELSPPFFRSFQYIRSGSIEGLENEFEIYQRISRKIEDFLLLKDNNSSLITDTIDYLTNHGENEEESTAIIKILISEHLLYKYKRLKSGEYIEFSDLKANAEKSKQYYGSLADEIKIKSDKISLLVSHGQTVGNYREYILRSLLKKYIPSKFSVATGFIEGLPRQIDIIIYDSFNHSPTFIEGDLIVVRREAVRGIIEVKSTLSTKNLLEALQFFYDISRPGIYKPEVPIFKGIFAFDTEYSETKSLAGCIRDFYNVPYFEEQLQKKVTRDILYLQHEVTCVAVLKKHCVYSQYIQSNGNESDNMIPALISISDQRNIDIQTAMFIALLFDYLDVDFYAKRSTLKAFSKLHRSKTANIRIEAKLTSDDWFPRTAEENEHDFKQESIKKRLNKIDEWFSGSISTTEFLSIK